jgi:hypothetical protein
MQQEEAGPSGSQSSLQQLHGGGGSGGAFPAGITEEELAAMDPKGAKRLIANRQARMCSGQAGQTTCAWSGCASLCLAAILAVKALQGAASGGG